MFWKSMNYLVEKCHNMLIQVREGWFQLALAMVTDSFSQQLLKITVPDTIFGAGNKMTIKIPILTLEELNYFEEKYILIC